MILWLATGHEAAQVIPLLAKEGLGVVDRGADAGTHHPLPPPQPRKGVIFVAGGGLASGPQRTEKGEQMQKDVKIEGTN
jgi:hypothetical protein